MPPLEKSSLEELFFLGVGVVGKFYDFHNDELSYFIHVKSVSV